MAASVATHLCSCFSSFRVTDQGFLFYTLLKDVMCVRRGSVMCTHLFKSPSLCVLNDRT